MGGIFMSDDFLHQFQKAPQREFAASLYERISNPMKITSRTRSLRSAVLAASVVMMIGAAFFLSPASRAFAQDLLHQFGAFIFVQAPPEPKPLTGDASGQQAAGLVKKNLVQDQAEHLQKQPGANENSTASYAQDATAASQLTGFPVLAPAYLPDGYRIEDTSAAWTVLHENGEVRASISYGTQDESSFLTVEQLIHRPGESKAVESQEIVDVTVQGLPGIWMPDNPRKSMLVWDENGITYLIISNQLSLDEVLKVAESLGK
jgi:hypothetical protein